MEKYRILVLLSTYNGERFLGEQLESILSQQGVSLELLIRDDGSKDGTCDIIRDFANRYDNISWFSGSNLGFVQSFSLLMQNALTTFQETEYFAFADQDDIWMPQKLFIACQNLSKTNPLSPALFTSNSIVIDAKKTQRKLFHEGLYPQYKKGNVMIYSTEQGCSMVFNRKAVQLYSLHNPHVTWHDRWLYLICFYLGTVCYYHNPLFYYRIHDKNALATSIPKARAKSFFNRLRNAADFYLLGDTLTRHQDMAKEFYEQFSSNLSKRDKGLFHSYFSYRYNLISKFKLMFNKEYSYPFSDPFPYRRFLFFNLL